MCGECRRTTDLPDPIFSSLAFLPETSTLNLRFSFSCVSCFSPSSQFLESPRPSNSHSVLISLPIARSLPLCLSPSVCFSNPCLSFSDFFFLSFFSLPAPFLFLSLLFTVLAFVSLSQSLYSSLSPSPLYFTFPLSLNFCDFLRLFVSTSFSMSVFFSVPPKPSPPTPGLGDTFFQFPPLLLPLPFLSELSAALHWSSHPSLFPG